MSQPRSLYLDFVKGVLIFLVVLGHSIQYLEFSLTSNTYYNFLFKFIYMFHMPLFIAISGYFSYSSINKSRNFISFLKNKITHLLLPMLVWSILLYLIKYPTINHLILKDLFETIVTSYWFISAIFAYSILIYFLSKIKKHNTIILIISSIILTLLFIPYPFYATIQSMYPFFILGYLCKALPINKYLHITKKFLPLILFGFIICFFLWNRNCYVYETPSSFYNIHDSKITIFRFISACFSSISILYILHYIYRKTSSSKLTLYVCKRGQETLGTYLMQEATFLTFGVYFLNKTAFKANTLECIIISIFISIALYVITLLLSKNRLTKQVLLGR